MIHTSLCSLSPGGGVEGPGSPVLGAWVRHSWKLCLLSLQPSQWFWKLFDIYDKSLSATRMDFVSNTLTKNRFKKSFFFFFLRIKYALVIIMGLWSLTACVWIPAVLPACSLTLDTFKWPRFSICKMMRLMMIIIIIMPVSYSWYDNTCKVLQQCLTQWMISVCFHNTKYVDVSTEITKVIKGLLRTSQILQDGHT